MQSPLLFLSSDVCPDLVWGKRSHLQGMYCNAPSDNLFLNGIKGSTDFGFLMLNCICFLWDPCIDKKDYKIFLIYKEIQSGAVAKSYMRKSFLIYEEMREYFPIYAAPF